jgi:hypothetical protein
MFGRQSERFPLLDVKTSGGGRVVIGPCAAALVLRVLALGLVAATLVYAGPMLGNELIVLLRAWGI